jgi:hypothetical protein
VGKRREKGNGGGGLTEKDETTKNGLIRMKKMSAVCKTLNSVDEFGHEFRGTF